MLLAKSRKHWDDMGQLDPCWAILSEPGTKFGGWDLHEFLATGGEEIEALMIAGQELGLPEGRGRALDFGCGIGRLTRALGHYFTRVIGTDISESMLRQASELDPIPNISFVANSNDSLPFATCSFDLIYTAIVLQHVPQKNAVRRYVAEFVRTLKIRGLLVMQIPSYIPLRNRLQPRRRLYGWLREAGVPAKILYNKLGLHPIPMTFLPEEEVRAIVDRNGGKVLKAVPDSRAGSHISSRTYYVTKEPFCIPSSDQKPSTDLR